MLTTHNETPLESNSSENYSDEDILNPLVSYVNSITLVVSVIFILGILFNSISIVAILKSKKLEPVNLLILNLALADLVYIAGIPLFVVHVLCQSWPFHLLGCQLFFLTDFMGMIVGVYTVAALSVERYFEVADKKKRLEKFSNKFKILIINIYLVLIWLLGLMVSMPIVLSIKLNKSNDETYSCETQWDEQKMNILFFIKFIFIFFIPFSVITFSSLKLLTFLKKARRDSFAHLTVKYSKDINRTYGLNLITKLNAKEKKRKSPNLVGMNSAVRQKAIKIVLSIVSLFFLQWIPLWVGEVYKASTSQYEEYIHLFNILATLISYSNSISNPLLYIFLTHKFPFVHNIWLYLLNTKNTIFRKSKHVTVEI